MADFGIGLSGLNVAQSAIDLIGTNIANASTAGYHSQTLKVVPVGVSSGGGVAVGGGAEITAVLRNMDALLEREITSQQPMQGEINQQLESLQAIESSLGDLESQNLTNSLGQFFSSLQTLASEPTNQAYRQQVVWSANDLCTQFQNQSAYLQQTQSDLKSTAKSVVDQVNSLSSEIADLNGQIHTIRVNNGNANYLTDRRDQAINDLAQLVDVRATENANYEGMKNVTAAGTALVVGTQSMSIHTGTAENGQLGIAVQGSNFVRTNVQSGRLGAILNLSNEYVPQLVGKLDALAQYVIGQVNSLHAQGVGTSGSFDHLDTAPLPAGPVGDWGMGVVAGDVQIRVTNLSDHSVSRYSVHIDPTQSLQQIAADLNVPGLTVTESGGLHLVANPGFQFDFSPALVSQPVSLVMTGTARPTISGLYSGSKNEVYSLVATGSGEVGQTPGLTLAVIRGGVTINTINIGQGYAAGDELEVADGVRVSLASGSVVAGDSFSIRALSDTDTSGLLAAAGINGFFTGHSASTMGVRSDMLENPDQFASSLLGGASDNGNVARMADLANTSADALNGSAPSDFYALVITGIGENVKMLQARQASMTAVSQQLTKQRDQVSGVDVNDESAKLLMYERMFQSMSKFISTQNKALETLMNII